MILALKKNFFIFLLFLDHKIHLLELYRQRFDLTYPDRRVHNITILLNFIYASHLILAISFILTKKKHTYKLDVAGVSNQSSRDWKLNKDW